MNDLFEMVSVNDLSVEDYIRALRLCAKMLDPKYIVWARVYRATGELADLFVFPIEFMVEHFQPDDMNTDDPKACNNSRFPDED